MCVAAAVYPEHDLLWALLGMPEMDAPADRKRKPLKAVVPASVTVMLAPGAAEDGAEIVLVALPALPWCALSHRPACDQRHSCQCDASSPQHLSTCTQNNSQHRLKENAHSPRLSTTSLAAPSPAAARPLPTPCPGPPCRVHSAPPACQPSASRFLEMNSQRPISKIPRVISILSQYYGEY